MEKKDTNPKDALGCKKPPMSTIPCPVLMEVGVAMLEGAAKYRRHNYRVAGVRMSIYYDAAMRHLMAWWEGENIDPDSGLSHVSKAIASLVVLRDAMMNGMIQDDRPPSAKAGWMKDIQARVDDVLARYPEPLPPYVNGDANDACASAFTVGERVEVIETAITGTVEGVDNLARIIVRSDLDGETFSVDPLELRSL